MDIAIYGEKKTGMLLEADGPRNAKGESERVVTMLVDAFPAGCQVADKLGAPTSSTTENEPYIDNDNGG